MHHRVYMFVESYANAYRVSFLAPDLRTAIRPPWRTSDLDKVRDMFERAAESKRLKDRQAFEYALKQKRAACWLRLTVEQYATLARIGPKTAGIDRGERKAG